MAGGEVVRRYTHPSHSRGNMKKPHACFAASCTQTPALTQVLGNELVTAIHDENTPHIQLDVVLLLLVLKEVKGGTARDEEKRPEL